MGTRLERMMLSVNAPGGITTAEFGEIENEEGGGVEFSPEKQ